MVFIPFAKDWKCRMFLPILFAISTMRSMNIAKLSVAFFTIGFGISDIITAAFANIFKDSARSLNALGSGPVTFLLAFSAFACCFAILADCLPEGMPPIICLNMLSILAFSSSNVEFIKREPIAFPIVRPDKSENFIFPLTLAGFPSMLLAVPFSSFASSLPTISMTWSPTFSDIPFPPSFERPVMAAKII